MEDCAKQISTLQGKVCCFQSHTGSGKTTDFPKRLVKKGGRVVVAVPTRNQVLTVYSYVKRDFPCGYILGNNEFENKNASLVYVTVGWLFSKLLHSETKFDFLLVDEVHSIQKEYTGLIHLINKRHHMRPRQTAVYMSATFNPTLLDLIKYDEFVDLSRDKTMYPITRTFSPCGSSLKSCLDDTLPQLSHIASLIRRDFLHFVNQDSPKNCVMCFLPGKSDINTLAYLIKRNMFKTEVRYAMMELSGLNRHFNINSINPEHFTIILATEIARTGFTIPQVSKVYDACIVKQEVCKDFDTLELEPILISQSEREQSEGRIGRVKKDIKDEYIYICEQHEFKAFGLTKSLETTVGDNLHIFLQLFSRGVEKEELQKSFGDVKRLKNKLKYITAFDQNKELSLYGKLIDMIPAHYLLVRMVWIAIKAQESSIKMKIFNEEVEIVSKEDTTFSTLVEVIFLSMWGQEMIDTKVPPADVDQKDVKQWIEDNRNAALSKFRGRNDLDFAGNLWNHIYYILKEHKFQSHNFKFRSELGHFAKENWLNYNSLIRFVGSVIATAGRLGIDYTTPVTIDENIYNIFIEAHSDSILANELFKISYTDGTEHYARFPIALSNTVITSNAIYATNGFVTHKTTHGTKVKMFKIGVPVWIEGSSNAHKFPELENMMLELLNVLMTMEQMESLLDALRDFVTENFSTYSQITLADFMNFQPPLLKGSKAKKVLAKIEPGVCAICQEDVLRRYEIVTLLECTHFYHTKCYSVMSNFSSKVHCPLCRVEAVVLAEGIISCPPERDIYYDLDSELEPKVLTLGIEEYKPLMEKGKARFTLTPEQEKELFEEQNREREARRKQQEKERQKRIVERRKAEKEKMQKERKLAQRRMEDMSRGKKKKK